MPQVKITDPKTGVKYTLPEGVEPTVDVIRRVIEYGRKADADADAVSESPRSWSGQERLDDGRTMRWQATQETDGGAMARWERSGPKLSEGPDAYAALDLDKIGAENDAFKNGRVMKWMRSFDRAMGATVSAPVEVGRLGLDYAKLALMGPRSGVDPMEAARRGSRLLTPFLDQLEAGVVAGLPESGPLTTGYYKRSVGGVDAKAGADALKGSFSKLWDEDPVGALVQGAAVAAGVGGAGGALARRAMAPEVLRVPGVATRGVGASDLFPVGETRLVDPSIDVANVDRIKAATATVGDLMGVPKGLKAGFDLSAPGRQGAPLALYTMLKNPKGYVGAWSDMLQSAKPGNFLDGKGEVNYAAAVAAIKDHPDFGAARKSGLKLSAVDGNEAGHAWSGGSAGPGPISRTVGKLPGLGMSERAFNAFMDRLRIEAFSTMKKAAGPKAAAKDLADLADVVNVASGYGDPMASLNELQRVASGHAQNLEKLRGPLSSLTSNGLFSARNTAARFQYLNPVRYARMSKGARKVAAEQMAYHALGAGVVIGLAAGLGATVAGPSPKGEGVTGDFGKIKIGDTRYEVTGGYARQVRLTLALGQVAAGQGSEKEKLETMRDLLAQFFRNSASPVAGAALDSALPQYKPVGAPETASARALDMVMPLMAKDFLDAFTQKQDGGLKGLAQVSPSVFGVGVQKYQSGRGGATRRGVDRAFESRSGR